MRFDGHVFHKEICPVCHEEFDQGSDGRPKTCSRTCARRLDATRNGGHSRNYKGGRWKINSGYWKVLAKDHPRADTAGYVLEHILVMEKYLGRYLEPFEHIHHKNKQRDDNRLENLELWMGDHPHGARMEDMLQYMLAQLRPDIRNEVEETFRKSLKL